MRNLIVSILLIVAACQREPAPASAASPVPASPPLAVAADPAAANAAYEARQFARCAELYTALGERGGAEQANDLYGAACCHALDGKVDQAFAMLDRSIKAGFRDDEHLAADEDLAPLRFDPRWAAIIRAVEAARDAAGERIGDPALRRELKALYREDQAARNAWIKSDFKDAAAEQQVREADRKSLARLEEVVANHGWPGKSLVGEEAAHAAWLLVQHADADRAFQKQCLALLEKAAETGEATKADYAYLYDRVAVGEKRPQRYGTQYKDGKPAPIEDEARVDERRKVVGLGTMAEYEREMRDLYGENVGAKK